MHCENFESKFQEKSDLNQYWYSSSTVIAIRDELIRLRPQRIAFVSTPSLFFSVCDFIQESYLFDFDVDFERAADGRFVRFDYRYPQIDTFHHISYDAVVMDPPFISEEVISAYAKVYRDLAKTTGSLLLFTTTPENQQFLESSLNSRVHQATFLPCIPNLVYQYRIFVNYEIDSISSLRVPNGEVGSPE